MRRLALVLLLSAVAVLVGVTSARADGVFYFVTGVGDVNGSCAPYPNVPGAFQCTTLRAAVDAANADAAADEIYLQDGQTYSVNQAIPLTTDVDIFSGNARTTTLQSASVDRLFTIAPSVNVTLYGVTLKGGRVFAGEGGAILNQGTLDLIETRLTVNVAPNGGAISNAVGAELDIEYSLIDHNQAPGVDTNGTGGAIFNHGTLDINDSTIALNTASHVGGITSDTTTDTTDLDHVTLAGNASTTNTSPGGVQFSGPWFSTGSLFAANHGTTDTSNCGGPVSGGSGNIEDGTTCGFGPASAQLPHAPIALIDDGGMTDVVDVTGTAAKSFEARCTSGLDQRLGQRPFNAPCDSGAYQQGVPAGAVAPQFPFPTATPSATPPPTPTPPPPPTPTASPTPTPTPVPGQSVVAKPVKGTIKIKRPGTNTFIELDATQGIPVGSTVDTRLGTVQLTALQKPGGKTETANFFDGLFKLTQTRTTTDLTLVEPLAPCPKSARASAVAAKKKPKTRQLWGDGHGSFRTRGQYSAATVRGTKWFVQDSCAGTLTRVAQGVVSVQDNVRRKTIILRAGKKYLARPRR